ncbi:M48 family metallopeptidase [Planctomycetota bacterium]
MDVQVIRSKRRRKTIQAHKVGDTLEIRAPAHVSDEQLKPHIDRLLKRITVAKRYETLDPHLLDERANRLNRQYFDNRLRWTSITWASNQHRRFGSCQTQERVIRISHQLAKMPLFVLDYVIIHELAHLVVPNHSRKFWNLVERYPKTERARGYLMAVGLGDVDS